MTNSTLQAIRKGLLLSQDEFARALREAGQRAGVPNDASKRLVQRWESGESASPRPVYARALESVTGLPITELGFAVPVPAARVTPNGQGGHDVAASGPDFEVIAPVAHAGKNATSTNYSGIWLSRYEYYSSGRGDTFIGVHYVLVLQHGDRLTARSLPGSSDSPLTMDLTVDGSVVTGTWVEQTHKDGYYRGARYHGAIQMIAEPTGRKISGKWLGFGKEMEVNSGPWALIFQDASTNKSTMNKYNKRPPVE
ncbi:helix-turn-helix domain-containing protein [Stackebrandtia nassauensis]|uniref:Transcriptional regulator, XRE family n=1 Tax=Stackebrandtia nassauensis (strain DSM 44728 / CIP 108903 / NRRL B-16338 / NBRC 102104 / LLR-40K-21) TaxID=446470 RepID=D3PV17_STANL|nr:transcriptional regulator [Stackebrandtia nassauensis]ADD45041.1 transcriptional regulator, XRE family [Stackebrandtia nassauensis DSM 44728]